METSKGELWRPLVYAPPSPAGSMSISSEFILSNSAAWGDITGRMPLLPPWTAVYDVTTNGALLQRSASWTGSSWNLGLPQEADTLTNWVSVQVVGAVAYGLTIDGTVWTWGYDLGRDHTPTFRARIAALEEQMMRAPTAARSGFIGINGVPQEFQKEPRPLMKLIQQSNTK